MSDAFEADGLAAVPERASEAASALEGLREPAERAAGAIGEAFDRAGESLARSLARAAADGEVSLAELARAVLAAVNSGLGAGAGAATGGGLGAAVTAALGGLFGGTRADGGPVSAGAAYLVGERGPEVFRPGGTGTIEPVAGPGVTINVSVDGGAPALLRSEAQIAQMLARAVALGARRL
jgi:hypothetical protein